MSLFVGMQPSRVVPGTALQVSVVLGVRDEEDSVGLRVRHVAEHLRALGKAFELLAVNDGSFDASFAVLRLLEAALPELKLLPTQRGPHAFLRGAAAAEGRDILLCQGQRKLALAPVSWALGRLDEGTAAVVARGHWVAARRLTILAPLSRAGGRGEVFERSLERAAKGLRVTVVGNGRATGASGAVATLLEPVLRLLSA